MGLGEAIFDPRAAYCAHAVLLVASKPMNPADIESDVMIFLLTEKHMPSSQGPNSRQSTNMLLY